MRSGIFNGCVTSPHCNATKQPSQWGGMSRFYSSTSSVIARWRELQEVVFLQWFQHIQSWQRERRAYKLRTKGSLLWRRWALLFPFLQPLRVNLTVIWRTDGSHLWREWATQVEETSALCPLIMTSRTSLPPLVTAERYRKSSLKRCAMICAVVFPTPGGPQKNERWYVSWVYRPQYSSFPYEMLLSDVLHPACGGACVQPMVPYLSLNSLLLQSGEIFCIMQRIHSL